MKQLLTQIEINAPAEKVWKVLSDFESYPRWNPFVKELKGNVTPGATIEITLQPPGGSVMKFKPKVLTYETNKGFSWLGKLFIKGLFDGEHIFELAEISPGKTRLTQRENFEGILIPLLSSMIDNQTRQGFEAMNAKVKELAEK